MTDFSLFEKVCIFLFIICFFFFVLAILLNSYYKYKIHEFIKYHSEQYVVHDYCMCVHDTWFCYDDYFVPID